MVAIDLVVVCCAADVEVATAHLDDATGIILRDNDLKANIVTNACNYLTVDDIIALDGGVDS